MGWRRRSSCRKVCSWGRQFFAPLRRMLILERVPRRHVLLVPDDNPTLSLTGRSVPKAIRLRKCRRLLPFLFCGGTFRVDKSRFAALSTAFFAKWRTAAAPWFTTFPCLPHPRTSWIITNTAWCWSYITFTNYGNLHQIPDVCSITYHHPLPSLSKRCRHESCLKLPKLSQIRGTELRPYRKR